MNRNNGNYIFMFVTLGLLTAFGPFLTDFYLPALPSLAEYFETSPSLAQMSLTTGMLGLAAGQVIIGPASDRYGRKRPLMASMAAIVLATLLCILSPSITTFNAMRFFQGMAGAGGIVIARSIATDMYTGHELTRFIAMIAAVNGVVPVVGPVIGGMMLNFTSWKGTFALLLAVGILLTGMCSFVRESLPVRRRSQERIYKTFNSYGKVFRNPKYVWFLASFAFSMLVLFAYISSSPFILQERYGLSPIAFSMCFGANALAIGIGCALSNCFRDEYRNLKTGALLLLAAAAATAAALLLHAPIWILEPAFLILMLAFGVLQPVCTSVTLDSERDNAGTASAALGASGFLMGGAVSPLAGIGDIFISAAAAITTGAVLTCATIFHACRVFDLGEKGRGQMS